MNAAFLLLPFLAVRFGLMAALGRDALQRAAHFAPMQGTQRVALVVYQVSNGAIFLGLFFFQVQPAAAWWFLGGAVCYLAGLGLCAAAVASFASPGRLGLNTAGAYRISRNPMYAAYFICFLGMALLAKSLFLAGAVLVFQLSARWLVLAEERWCEEIFGEEYRQYKKQVRRWL